MASPRLGKPALASAWAKEVADRLALVRRLQRQLGEDVGRYTPSACAQEEDLVAFEQLHRARLPADFRDFLRYVGEGGVGPEYGITRLTSMVMISDATAGRGLLIGEIGCGYFYLLVVDGPNEGEVWEYTTAGDGGIRSLGAFRAWFEAWLDVALAYGAMSLAERSSGRPQQGKARAILSATSARVFAIEARSPGLRACAAHVRLALGDRDGARAALPFLEGSSDGRSFAAGLRRDLYAEEIQAALAQHPPAALAQHVAREVRLALAGNVVLPAAVVDVLAADRDGDVRALAARHPNAPPRLLTQVTVEAIDAMRRGELGLHMAMVLELALRNPASPMALVDAAIAAGEAHRGRMAAVVLRGAALSHACTETHRRRLARSPWPEVRHAVACLAATSATDIAMLADDPDRLVRAAVAARRDLPPSILVALSADRDRLPRQAVAANPTTPPSCLARLALDLELHDHVRNNPRCSPELVAAFELLVGVDHVDRKVDPRDVPVPRLFCDEHENPATKPAADVHAARDVGHSSFPVVALEASIEAHMAAYTLSSRVWLEPDLVLRLANDPYAYTRANIAARAETPALLVARLARDPVDVTRNVAALNPVVPVTTLVALLDDPVDTVREGVAMNPSLPPEHLARVAQDASPYARRGVARSPHASVELLQLIARDPSEYVRRFVALAPAATPAILSVLASDSDAQTRGRVAFRRAVEGYAKSVTARH